MKIIQIERETSPSSRHTATLCSAPPFLRYLRGIETLVARKGAYAGDYHFYATYEELKRHQRYSLAYSNKSFYATYEELKLQKAGIGSDITVTFLRYL